MHCQSMMSALSRPCDSGNGHRTTKMIQNVCLSTQVYAIYSQGSKIDMPKKEVE